MTLTHHEGTSAQRCTSNVDHGQARCLYGENRLLCPSTAWHPSTHGDALYWMFVHSANKLFILENHFICHVVICVMWYNERLLFWFYLRQLYLTTCNKNIHFCPTPQRSIVRSKDVVSVLQGIQIHAVRQGMSKLQTEGQSQHGIRFFFYYKNSIHGSPAAKQIVSFINVAISLFTSWWQHHSGSSG